MLIEKAAQTGKDETIFLHVDANDGINAPGSKVGLRHDAPMKNRPNLEKCVHVGGKNAAREAAKLDDGAFLEKLLV